MSSLPVRSETPKGCIEVGRAGRMLLGNRPKHWEIHIHARDISEGLEMHFASLLVFNVDNLGRRATSSEGVVEFFAFAYTR